MREVVVGVIVREGRFLLTQRVPEKSYPLTQPLSTVCATDDRHLVAPIIVPHYGGPNGHPTAARTLDRPVGTVTSRDHTSLVAAWLTKFYGSAGAGSDVREPFPTITAGGKRGGQHVGLVKALLVRYAGWPRDREPTLELGGATWRVEDVGMRMFGSRELARAQGFDDSYDLSAARTKTAEIELIGNSVCNQIAEALVAANVRARSPQLHLWASS